MKKNVLGGIRKTLPVLDGLRAQVKGDPDLELVVRRLEQMELLLEGLAEKAAAKTVAEEKVAETKIATNRTALSASMSC
jgi:hypothetical protein